MKFNQPVTMEYIENGSWFLFGAIGGLGELSDIHIVLASLTKIIDFSLLSPKEEKDNDIFCFKTVDVSTLKKCSSANLPRAIVEVQIDKGVYKIVEFENEVEEAKFNLLK